jgi:hypothetical protein
VRAPTLRAILVALMLALPAVAALAPAAQAQGPLPQPTLLVNVEVPQAHVPPLGPAVRTSGVVELTAFAPPLGSQRITLAVLKAPAWAEVVVSPPEVYIDLQPFGTTWVGEAEFEVELRASEQAPAFAPGPVVVGARLDPGTLSPGADAETSFPVVAGWFPLLDVQAASPVRVPAGERHVFPVTVTNFGNANTKVLLELVGKPGKLDVQLPASVVLQSKQAGGTQTSTRLPLGISAPADFTDTTPVTLRVTPVYALDATLRGEESIVTILVDPRGGTTSAHAAQPMRGGAFPASSGADAPTGRAEDGTLRTLTAPESSWTLPDGGPSYPFVGALVGGLVGLGLARRRLRA